MTPVSRTFAEGIRLHQAGELRQAEAQYHEVLRSDPRHYGALHLLGLIARTEGQLDGAAHLIRQALSLRPDFAEAHGNLGIVLWEQGKPAEAIEHQAEALRLKPDFADAHSNLALALRDLGRPEDAEAHFRHALALRPDHAEAHNNLGNLLLDQGRVDEAITSYRHAIETRPDHADAHNNLGNAFRELRQFDAAEASLREALRLNPAHLGALSNLGIVLCLRGHLEEAEVPLREALRLAPSTAVAHHNLGLVLLEQGRPADAVVSLRAALAARPGYATAHQSLGQALFEQGQFDEAIASLRQALHLQPDLAGAHNSLGNVQLECGDLEAAEASFHEALRLSPDFAHADNNLGNVLKDRGEIDAALHCYRRALNLAPDSAIFHSNLVFTLHFHPASDALSLAEEHRAWNRQHAEPLSRHVKPHENDRDPDRRLRVGYVSPDFRQHPVARFLLPLLEAHDRRRVELLCYSSVVNPDAMTGRLRGVADAWCEVAGLTDDRLAERVRADRIDILVDLASHTSGNRLLVFARKPAPVQATYLAYCSTTGLRAMDYRFTDPYLDPPDSDLGVYSERSIRLPETYWCYRPPAELPLPGPSPVASNNAVTFGCLNNFGKVSDAALAAWSELLRAVPGSRLILHAHEGRHRERVRGLLTRSDVDPERVEFVGFMAPRDYFRLYDRIDLALDPFPYGGGTTTCDALWMGVPVVSRFGATAVSRAGRSILSNAGLPELAVDTTADYVRLAAELANDRDRVVDLRRGLRDRLWQSPLTNEARFAQGVESAYRTMWHNWLAAGERV